MFVSEIKRLYKVCCDGFSFNSNDQPLTDLFLKANTFYWNRLADRWNDTLDNSTEIAPIVVLLTTLAPISNTILYSDLPNYDRLGFLRPTYVVNGFTYSNPSKAIAENNKYSKLSTGTFQYPRHYFTDTGIVLQPDDTPTNVYTTYLRIPFVVDFTIPDYDVPINNINVFNTIGLALSNLGVSQREFDMFVQNNNLSTINNAQ